MPALLRLLLRVLQRGEAPQAARAASRGFCAAEAEKEDGRPGQGQPPPFDRGLLEILVCPLSKKPLRYDESTNELINEELGIAYPIIDGMPNMIPQAARLMGKGKQEKESE